MKKLHNITITCVSLFFVLSINNANAQTCETPPTCEALGFTKTVAECTDHTTLHCPFDNNKVYCDTACGKTPEKKTYKINETIKFGQIETTVFRIFDTGNKQLVWAFFQKELIHWEECSGICKNHPFRIMGRGDIDEILETGVNFVRAWNKEGVTISDLGHTNNYSGSYSDCFCVGYFEI